jgi:Domain of unknown function (DU1801)
MNIDAKTREEYFVKTGEREPELRELDKLVREAAPDLEPVLFGGMSGKMLGYGMQSYKTKSMKEESQWPVVALAAQKNYISLYICALVDGQYMAEVYENRLGKVSCGKSCIRFKRLEDLNLDTTKDMLVEINRRFKNGDKLYGF